MLATDPLSLLLLGCALFSGLFLVATLALGAGHAHLGHLGHVGHIGHLSGSHSATSPQDATSHASAHAAGQAGHDGPPPAPSATGESLWSAAQSLLMGSLNLNSALIFLLVFGVLGYLLHNGGNGQGAGLLTVVVVAALVGALAAIGVNAALTRIFITSQAGELPAESSRLDGHLASVSIAIRAQGLGEIVYSGEAGARHSIGARSSDGAAIPAGTQVVIVATEHGLATVQSWDGFLAETRQRLSAEQPVARLTPAAPPGDEPQPGA